MTTGPAGIPFDRRQIRMNTVLRRGDTVGEARPRLVGPTIRDLNGNVFDVHQPRPITLGIPAASYITPIASLTTDTSIPNLPLVTARKGILIVEVKAVASPCVYPRKGVLLPSWWRYLVERHD